MPVDFGSRDNNPLAQIFALYQIKRQRDQDIAEQEHQALNMAVRLSEAGGDPSSVQGLNPTMVPILRQMRDARKAGQEQQVYGESTSPEALRPYIPSLSGRIGPSGNIETASPADVERSLSLLDQNFLRRGGNPADLALLREQALQAAGGQTRAAQDYVAKERFQTGQQMAVQSHGAALTRSNQEAAFKRQEQYDKDKSLNEGWAARVQSQDPDESARVSQEIMDSAGGNSQAAQARLTYVSALARGGQAKAQAEATPELIREQNRNRVQSANEFVTSFAPVLSTNSVRNPDGSITVDPATRSTVEQKARQAFGDSAASQVMARLDTMAIGEKAKAFSPIAAFVSAGFSPEISNLLKDGKAFVDGWTGLPVRGPQTGERATQAGNIREVYTDLLDTMIASDRFAKKYGGGIATDLAQAASRKGGEEDPDYAKVNQALTNVSLAVTTGWAASTFTDTLREFITSQLPKTSQIHIGADGQIDPATRARFNGLLRQTENKYVSMFDGQDQEAARKRIAGWRQQYWNLAQKDVDAWHELSNQTRGASAGPQGGGLLEAAEQQYGLPAMGQEDAQPAQ